MSKSGCCACSTPLFPLLHLYFFCLFPSLFFVLLRLSPSASCVPILPLLFLLPSQPQFESHLRSLARATINTKRNSGVYRNVLMYGPPGTGKTMFAKVGKWDKDMSTAVRRGGKGGRGVCMCLLLLFLLLLCSPTFLFYPPLSESCSSLWNGLCYHDGRRCGTPRQGGGDCHAQSV